MQRSNVVTLVSEASSPENRPAIDIAERVLLATGAATMEGDFESYTDLFELPQRFDTFEGYFVVRTPDDLFKVFSGVRCKIQNLGVTDMVRRVISAEYKSETEIITTHETRLMRGNEQMEGVFPTHSMLRCTDGKWRVANATYAVDKSNPVYSSFSPLLEELAETPE